MPSDSDRWVRRIAVAVSGTEIAAAVRHEAVNVLERSFHWIMLLRQPEQMRGMSAEDAVEGLETELRLLEQSLRKLDGAISPHARPSDR